MQVTRTSSLETVRNMVASGLGVSVLPRDALTPKYHSRLVVPVPFGAGAVATDRGRVAEKLSAAGRDSRAARSCAGLPHRRTRREGKKRGVTLARNPLVHVVGGIGFEPTTPAV